MSLTASTTDAGRCSFVVTVHSSDLQPVVTVILPTKNEAENVEALLARLAAAMCDIRFELLFVDDSSDNTLEVIAQVSERFAFPITVLARPPERRGNGLGGAVVEGFALARAPWVCVMDADLQHPPELIPRLLEQAERTDSDVVVAGRDFTHGTPSGLGPLRTATSRALNDITRMLFPKRLRDVSDPLTGFFLVRREAVELARLRPRGFKILLELLVKFPEFRVSERLFTFGTRHAGKSKASLWEGFRYFSLLWSLHAGSNMGRFLRFGVVGMSGIVVNSLALAFATEVLGIHYLISTALATVFSTSWNFIGTEFWAFAAQRRGQGLTQRFILFSGMNVSALALREPIIWVLTDLLGIHYLLSNLASLTVLMVLRYMLADRWIWGFAQRAKRPTTIYALPAPSTERAGERKEGRMASMLQVYTYDVHGILSVASEVALPELESFCTDKRIGQATVRVRIDKLSHSQRLETSLPKPNSAYHIHYDEGFGSLGFSVEIHQGETVEVLVSPLLRWSPHVLYTNVVEPILRWTFVQKGYALVHAACVAFGDKAYIITAKTDTGKTTTLLQLLNHQRRATDTAAFVSDDLTLVTPSGCVLTYPKPLTISYHTMRVVNNQMVSGLSRMQLHLQSRVHSRTGRKVALGLAKTQRLPMSTVNAVVQGLIPPPKYPVQRLIPCVKFAHNVKLAGLFIIERGEEATIPLGSQEALEILLSNCEDAYGFPPYPSIKEFLYKPNGSDLRPLERQIISQAFTGLPATLFRSANMEWWRRITRFVGMSLDTRSNDRLGPGTPALRADPSVV